MKECYLLLPQEVEVSALKSGTAVILRRSIVEVAVQDEDNAEPCKAWECDEVQFRFPGSITTEEIKEDFDYWYEHGPSYVEEAREELTLEELREEKYREVGAACEATIYAGVDVQLSTGYEHFSLTEKDQINLFGKQVQLAAGAEKLEYHQDGQPCRYYSATDMKAIIDAAVRCVSWNTTYCNALNMWIRDAATRSELEKVSWGAEIPEKYQNEVYLDYTGEGK